MVELLALEASEDLEMVEDLLRQFHDKTGSQVAAEILADWPVQASSFVKVLYHYFLMRYTFDCKMLGY